MNGHPRALVEASLERVLQSTVFRRSDRHRRFMRHVVGAALEGRSDILKEVLLGIELFDRRLDAYDPRHDPIVRVEAGRIRAKLTRYYLSEGSSDRYGFDIPTGGYVPRFERRDPARPARAAVETYAVMPFATSSGDDESFVIGLADQLINLLGRVHDLRVVARISVLKARERDLDLRELAKLLKVTRVIDGSFQRQGDRMRCIAHIFHGSDATRLWSQSFDSNDVATSSQQPMDAFAFQDHVAEGIVSAALPTIDGTLSPDRTDAVARPVRHDVSIAMQRSSRQLLDQATYLFRRFEATAAAKNIALAEQACRLDPELAQAHVLLAHAWFQLCTLNMASGRESRPRIEAALARALDLDPADSDALALDAMIAFRFGYDWPGAERKFRDALRISPHAGSINYRYAFCLLSNGRFDEGYRHLDAAVQLDPLNIGFRASSAHLAALTDVAAATAEVEALLELEPNHLFINTSVALIHLYAGRHEAALERFDRVVALHPDSSFARFGRIAALGYLGAGAAGRAELDASVAGLGTRYYSRYGLALSYLGLGDRPAAYAALEAAAVDLDATFCSVAVDPLFAPCHADPVFVELLARRGLHPIDVPERRLC